MCGLGVCAWARVSAAAPHSWLGCVVWVCVCTRVSAAPRHSWLGCWGPRGFVCPLGLYPAAPCSGVWFGCVFWLGFWLRPATPGWGVGVCVFLCARSACTPPLLDGVCGVVVCAGAQVSAAPHHSWPGCSVVCVFVCPLRSYPATPGWGVRCGCVCPGSGFGCAPPLLACVLGCVCVCVRAPLVPRYSWPGCAASLCVLGLGFRLRLAVPGWGVGSVCVRVRAPLVPRDSWLGCAAWVRVLGLRFRLCPATPGWSVGVCVCS